MSEQLKELISAIAREVAELPDRTSPEDWPEAMLVTGTELADILRDRLATLRQQLADSEARVRALEACALKYLKWLDVADPRAGLEQDLADPEMTGVDLSRTEDRG